MLLLLLLLEAPVGVSDDLRPPRNVRIAGSAGTTAAVASIAPAARGVEATPPTLIAAPAPVGAVVTEGGIGYTDMCVGSEAVMPPRGGTPPVAEAADVGAGSVRGVPPDADIIKEVEEEDWRRGVVIATPPPPPLPPLLLRRADTGVATAGDAGGGRCSSEERMGVAEAGAGVVVVGPPIEPRPGNPVGDGGTALLPYPLLTPGTGDEALLVEDTPPSGYAPRRRAVGSALPARGNKLLLLPLLVPRGRLAPTLPGFADEAGVVALLETVPPFNCSDAPGR